ncbi:MAG: cytochrome C oxidase subunit IV family protein [Phycisphaerales bacterium]
MSHDHSHGPEIVSPGMKESHAHHGHVIVPKRTLVAVLAILMFFTGLTVFAANAEGWFATAFETGIPQWVNVAVALSIAVVKSVIVAMYFMQLRYDNPMNSAIAIFTFFVLACFLGFTMIDLGVRDALAPYKATTIEVGGTGGVKRLEPVLVDQNGQFVPGRHEEITVTGSIAAFSRDRAKKQIESLRKANVPMDQWPKTYRRWAEHLDHDAHHEHDRASSNSNQSRPRTGITLPELLGAAADGHDHDHSGKPADPSAKPAGGH